MTSEPCKWVHCKSPTVQQLAHGLSFVATTSHIQPLTPGACFLYVATTSHQQLLTSGACLLYVATTSHQQLLTPGACFLYVATTSHHQQLTTGVCFLYVATTSHLQLCKKLRTCEHSFSRWPLIFTSTDSRSQHHLSPSTIVILVSAFLRVIFD